ncbi:MAG: flavin-containing monooxygenase [Burkholderiaceae bacterium]
MTNSKTESTRVVIIGAGMSGLCMAMCLRRQGINDFLILEKSADVGGTWYENRYPGAQCDVQSHLYTFSFAPNPEWSRRYANSREIQHYLSGLTQQFDLHDRLRLNTRVKSARFDEHALHWVVGTNDGTIIKSQAIALSQAPLHTAKWPEIQGLEQFRGRKLHTALWPDQASFDGRRVGVIGNGASAVQLVPPVAAQAEHLTVFQRSANWVLPRGDKPFSATQKRLFAIKPIGKLYRWWLASLYESNRFGFVPDSFAGRLAHKRATSHLAKRVHDTKLRASLTPDYPVGCKRILITDEYYPTLQQPHVALETRGIREIEASGVRLNDGTLVELDDLICATGFDITGSVASVEVLGLAGKPLAASQRDKPQAMHGITVPDFPNLFLLLGPNTATGHTSTLLYIEAQVNYIIQCLQELERRKQHAMTISAEVFRQHNEDLQARLKQSVWGANCTSWYKTADGHNGTLYPGFTPQYRAAVRHPDFTQFEFT